LSSKNQASYRTANPISSHDDQLLHAVIHFKR
jgi:hypothetical protein